MRGLIFVLCTYLLTSCYVSRVEVRDGPVMGIQEEASNEYFFWGLKDYKKADVPAMTKGAKDYRIERKFDLYDCFWSILTLGVYTRTSVIVSR